MPASMGRDVGAKLCQLFGLDASKVQTIDIHISYDEPAMITVHSLVTVEDGNAVVSALQQYELRALGLPGGGPSHANRP